MNSLSPLDDYPIHQVAEVIRHVGTSDRNFYDRYYFNCHNEDDPDQPWLILGLGVYPNLGVADFFAVVRWRDEHIVVRGSRALGDDRCDLQIGPLRVEVLEGLQRLHLVLEPGHGDLSFDLEFDADSPAVLEPRHFQRQLERVTFDTMRFVQTGRWSGSMTVDGTDFALDGEHWRGNRDRSWGVRPVGEAEPPGRRAAEPQATTFFWIYAVMRFEEFAVIVIMQEAYDGERIMGDARRVWNDPQRAPEWLGRIEYDIRYDPGTRDTRSATLSLIKPKGATITVECEPVLANYLGIGTGYGLEQDWRHGMWQGELKVESLHQKVSELDSMLKLFCVTDHVARFTLTEADGTVHTGDGLYECAAIGPHEPSGFTDYTDVPE